MSILIKTVRVAGFRGLENLEVELEQTTVLTGMNNTGKTSFLKALQIALGNRQFVSQDDFFIKNDRCAEQITIDMASNVTVVLSGKQLLALVRMRSVVNKISQSSLKSSFRFPPASTGTINTSMVICSAQRSFLMKKSS
jgi:recombinational DNA repair ATPase RecF